MMGGAADDLTDTWHGRFSYPRGGASVAFTARLQQAGASLTGDVEEVASGQAAPGRLLTSVVSGEVASARVSFLKTYTPAVPGYGTVHYEGTLRDGGLEIAGRWRIRGDWGGPFIMIRARGLPSAVEARRAEPVS